MSQTTMPAGWPDEITRTLPMTLRYGWILALLGGALQTNALVVESPATLDFNDLGPTLGGIHMPATYDGLSWSPFGDWYSMSIAAVPTNTFLALAGNATSFYRDGGRDFLLDSMRVWSRRGADANGRFYFILHHNGVEVYDGRDDQDGRVLFDATHQVVVPNYTGLVDVVALAFDAGGDDWDHLAVDDIAVRLVDIVPDAPTFIEVDPGLPSGTRNAVAWGDYNLDGWMDVFIAASGSQGTTITKVYRNQGGTFVDAALGTFTAIEEGSAAWGDCDNDGDPDLAVIGKTLGGATATRVYRNNITNFVAIPGPFVNVYAGDLGWADYDLDGDLDLLVTGITSSTPGSPFHTRLYRNDRTNFVSVVHPFPDTFNGPLAWGDYDADGDPDLFFSSSGADGGNEPDLFRNDGGTFTKINSGLPLQTIGGADWGDYDQDGDLDLLLTGQGLQGYLSAVYRNDSGIFTDIGAGLTGLIWSACAWGDCDNDGDLDFALAGYEAEAQIMMTKIYRNHAGTFVDTAAGTHGLYLGTLDWVDTNGDRRPELCAAGEEGNGNGSAFMLYRNTRAFTNTPPTAPSNLVVTLDGTTAVLSWSEATDAQSSTAGLAYQVRVGTTPGTADVLSASALASNGARVVSRLGGASPARQIAVQGLIVGSNYFWTVQAVDGARSGGPFAPEATFTAQDAPPLAVKAGLANLTPAITFKGSPYGSYRVEASSDLRTWTEVTNTAADAEGQVAISPDLNPDHLFYRAIRP
jgi:hypothetical protein